MSVLNFPLRYRSSGKTWRLACVLRLCQRCFPFCESHAKKQILGAFGTPQSATRISRSTMRETASDSGGGPCSNPSLKLCRMSAFAHGGPKNEPTRETVSTPEGKEVLTNQSSLFTSSSVTVGVAKLLVEMCTGEKHLRMCT